MKKPLPKTGYIVRAYRPRTNTTPTPPRVGDLMPFGEGPRPTLYRIGRVQPARAGLDDIDGDGVAISHYFRLDELDGKRDPFIWLELPAKYDVVRVTTSDYFANGQR